ncbi:MAG: hypothetical protein A3B16_00040 [Candidatus Zambryskibacteria bacterium RIFCSPLOWO2_01_FULL_45_43]|uniref:DUF5671 domain-containing protein n=1 Tax=Candidatus Zambryskibacteria bacterium RIFCSPLOWO2_01_FULL_45_43 TaxID=1802762 RepID=A0A1G2U623_9BACT|nr:MAG: hypothetical protein A3B16_00040 [Candidatus Zambryskibacteria bacterium RIFCSPLOWO2_01_FULL_45_43]
MDTKYTAKDFFLHIASIVLLYTGAIALLNILFHVINTAFPQVSQYNNYGYYNSNPISLPVATLIVVFPLLLILTNILHKSYESEPSRKEYAVRKWLIYITLFIAGGVLAGDLITVIYYFLDGQELTTAFVLKALSVLAVTGSIFGYYLDDLKDRLTDFRRNMWKIIAVILVVGSVVTGFSVLGSPRNQRFLKYDEQKINDLQSIHSIIQNYYQMTNSLPATLSDVSNPNNYFVLPTTDQQTQKPYEYRKTSDTSYELCAEFNKESEPHGYIQIYPDKTMYWDHPAGNFCFSLTIDPQLYPPKMR